MAETIQLVHMSIIIPHLLNTAADKCWGGRRYVVLRLLTKITKKHKTVPMTNIMMLRYWALMSKKPQLEF